MNIVFFLTVISLSVLDLLFLALFYSLTVKNVDASSYLKSNMENADN